MLTPTLIYEYFASLILIIAVHRFVGALFNRIGTPRIIGDIVAGCLLGPTVMGNEWNQALFPPLNRNIVKMFGQFGLIVTSMVAGFSFDRRVLKGRFGSVVLFTVLNMAIPTLLTLPLVSALPDDASFRGPDYNWPCYFTLLACGMSSSALPMVFLILDELKVDNALSKFAIGWSCLSTIGLFTLLSTASVLGQPNVLGPQDIIIRIALLIVLIVSLAIIQKLWTIAARYPSFKLSPDDITIVVMCLGLGSAIVSERLGYTFLLGAFLAGAAVPFDAGLRSGLGDKVRWLTRWIFLPQFFLDAGLGFDLRQIPPQDIPWIVLIVVAAFLSKATLIPVGRYLLKLSWREASFCASLANCRGFNALIIASTGKSLNMIGDSFFTACVCLSLLSTAATGPLARRFRPIDVELPTDSEIDAELAESALDFTGPSNSKTDSLLSMSDMDSSADGPAVRVAIGNAPAALAPHQVRYHSRGRETVARAVLIKQLANFEGRDTGEDDNPLIPALL